MKERLFYFSWLFLRVALKIDYTKYTFSSINFGYDYTEEVFRLKQLIYHKYHITKQDDELKVNYEKSARSNNRGDFEQKVFMREYSKVMAFAKMLPDWCDFYVELVKLINAGDDRKTIEWLAGKGVNVADMWRPKEPDEVVLEKDNGAWEWRGRPFDILFDIKTFGAHYKEYGRICEYLHKPRFKDEVFGALDKALQIEYLENRQDLVDYLQSFSEKAEYNWGIPRYRDWIIRDCNIKFMERWAEREPQQATSMNEEEKRFKDKYGDYGDIDNFMKNLATINGREVRRYYDKNLNKSNFSLKEFVSDFLKLVPQRKNERGLNYNAIKGH